MEIGQKAVDELEAITRIDEERRLPLKVTQLSVRISRRFQRTRSGSAHGNQALALSLGGHERGGGAGREPIVLCLHGMRFDHRTAQRSKGPWPYVQSDFLYLNALLLQSTE